MTCTISDDIKRHEITIFGFRIDWCAINSANRYRQYIYISRANRTLLPKDVLETKRFSDTMYEYWLVFIATFVRS